MTTPPIIHAMYLNTLITYGRKFGARVNTNPKLASLPSEAKLNDAMKEVYDFLDVKGIQVDPGHWHYFGCIIDRIGPELTQKRVRYTLKLASEVPDHLDKVIEEIEAKAKKHSQRVTFEQAPRRIQYQGVRRRIVAYSSVVDLERSVLGARASSSP